MYCIYKTVMFCATLFCRCRALTGLAGRACEHCRLDERFVAWEVGLFALDTRALQAGVQVSAEEAIRQVCRPPSLQFPLARGHTRVLWAGVFLSLLHLQHLQQGSS